jgi:tRNA threonylcarbamoyl adenosine modification protein (Sua5/YciO/YrdC/YwlC family)
MPRPLPKHIDTRKPDPGLIREAARFLAAGDLIVVPTETVYGLAGDPQFPDVERRIYALKGRDEKKPLPLMASDAAQVLAAGAVMDGCARRLARRFWPGPLTMVLDTPAGEEGFRVPDHGVMRAILKAVGHPLRVTSANLSGKPPAVTAAEAADALGSGVALILDAGPCRIGAPSTVVRLVAGGFEILRQGALSAKELAFIPTVLFVCTGNTCRSTMAEYAFRERLKESGLSWRTASAGVDAYPGCPASSLAVSLLAKRGIDASGHCSRLLTRELIDEAGLIVVMTQSHLRAVLRRFPDAAPKVRLMRDFDTRAQGRDVEDPIGGSPWEYSRILAEIEAGFPELLLTVHDLEKADRSGGKEQPS